jgi:hypothetical protein
MSPTQDHIHGRVPEALARWAEQLAAGRSWVSVEDEILSSCQGRVDLLTGLLIQAETLCGNGQTAKQLGSIQGLRSCA